LILLLSALLATPFANAAASAEETETAQQKFTGKVIANPDRVDGSATDSTDTAVATSTRNSSFNIEALTNADVSLYRAWFDFTRDDDGDGYFHQFALNFDLDTRLSSAEIYVTGQLNNGASTPLFRTDPFTIRGATGSDSYQATVLLTDGYPATRYELTLRVYDARSNALLLTYGPNQDNNLAELYLEDVTREAVNSGDVDLFVLEFTLFGDQDGDRYYTRSDVRFDADAPGQTLNLYASLYLIDEHGSWIPLRNTDTFTVSGYAHNDAVTVGFDLNNGFDPQVYRLGLEIHDARTDALLLTSVTPDATPLHMESADYDARHHETDDHHDDGHSGGSLSLMLLGLFALLLLRRIRTQ
ncbi:MAG TPA: choice-of-anchor H family protein, partial [Dongiaceae bacterium]|nr:choice-of-anchor H family protein [Dongiaceae bacterium]